MYNCYYHGRNVPKEEDVREIEKNRRKLARHKKMEELVPRFPNHRINRTKLTRMLGLDELDQQSDDREDTEDMQLCIGSESRTIGRCTGNHTSNEGAVSDSIIQFLFIRPIDSFVHVPEMRMVRM